MNKQTINPIFECNLLKHILVGHITTKEIWERGGRPEQVTVPDGLADDQLGGIQLIMRMNGKEISG